MRLTNIIKHGFRFLLLQSVLTLITIYYFDNFIIGSYKNGFNIIVNNLLDDRSRFYPFISQDFIKIDIYLAIFVFIFLVIIYNSKNYSIVNELDLALEKSLFDEYFYIFLIWCTSFLSFLQLFRFTSVSRGYTLLFTLIVPFILVIFRNSELLSKFLGRNPSSENYITFNLDETSVFRELRLLKLRKNLINFNLDINQNIEDFKIHIEEISRNNSVNIVVINLEKLEMFDEDIEKYLLNLNKKILIISDNRFRFTNKIIYRHKNLGNKNLYYLNNDIQYGSKYILKRIFDIFFSLILFLLSLPLFLTTGIFILISDGWPILNKQIRVGLHGKTFTLYKFRSMKNNSHQLRSDLKNSNEKGGPLFKMTEDPRFITGAKYLRRLSLDELPQIINVLKGDMSLVGPRPLFPEDNEFYDHHYLRRLNVLPGITGLLQINDRNTSNFEIWYKYDLEYIENWSLFLDFKILLKTPFVLFKKDTLGK
jgi:lipopolysaccharide/colanic/teichoic acid biosynthesis glycosyltransferase